MKIINDSFCLESEPFIPNDTNRPTVLVLALIHPGPNILLVRPVNADPSAWMPPQGGIEDGESILGAALRELQEELGYGVDVFLSGQARSLCIGVGQPYMAEPRKTYYCITLPMKHWVTPPFVNQDENDDFITVGSPYELWSRVHCCSQSKVRLISTCIAEASKKKLLYGDVWCHSKINMIHGYMNRGNDLVYVGA